MLLLPLLRWKEKLFGERSKRQRRRPKKIKKKSWKAFKQGQKRNKRKIKCWRRERWKTWEKEKNSRKMIVDVEKRRKEGLAGFQPDNEIDSWSQASLNLIENDWEESRWILDWLKWRKNWKGHLKKNKSPRAQWNWFP